MGIFSPAPMTNSAWYCAFAVVLIVARVAADVPHDLSSLDQPIELDTASPSDDLESLSKEQLLSFLKGQNAAHEMQVADLKKQNAAQNAAHEGQNAAHETQVADLKKQNRELGEQ